MPSFSFFISWKLCESVIVPLLVPQMVGDQFGMGMDDTHMKIRGAPVLDEPALSPHQKMIADKLAVSELMSMAMVALPPIVKVSPCLTVASCCFDGTPW